MKLTRFEEIDRALEDIKKGKIDLDLSKALFVLSYNDVDSIDKILLDRIHRIKFKGLTLDEKIVISRKHILPEVFEKVGLEGVINIEDNVLKFIIDELIAINDDVIVNVKEILKFGELASNVFPNATLEEKRIILNSLGSNLLIKDRKLQIQFEKPKTGDVVVTRYPFQFSS